MERKRNSTWLRTIRRTLATTQRWMLTLGIVALALVAGWIVYGLTRMGSETAEAVIQPTPIDIESVRPRGELYVCTAMAEDYATLRHTEVHLGLFPETHSCVQMLRQKVSYRLDLEQVHYVADTLNVMIVEMPPLIYTATTQDSPFMSDDEDYWRKALPSTNGLKQQAEQKIRQRFDSPANRQKAEQYAQQAIRQLLRQFGYEARFAPRLQPTDDQ